MTNPILKELYDIRREILAEHEDDLQEYLHAEFVRAKAAGHPVAKIKQRTIRRIKATKPEEQNVKNMSLLSVPSTLLPSLRSHTSQAVSVP